MFFHMFQVVLKMMGKRMNTDTYCRQFCLNYVTGLLVLVVTVIFVTIFELSSSFIYIFLCMF